MSLLKLRDKHDLDFKYNINLRENILNLNIDDYLDLAIRNNKKRRFLFVSKTLGKHLPCNASDMDSLGKYIVEVYEKKYNYLNCGVVISFAETGTALGHSVFNYINGNFEFIHTTRETVEGKKTLDFLEEHSHATNHNLYYDDLKYLKNGEEVILVDDEITTGNTCVNLIKKINELYPKKRYTICSILNWMDEEAFYKFKKLEKELNTEINFVYLFSGSFTFDCDEDKVENIIAQSGNKGKVSFKNNGLKVSYISLDMDKYPQNNKYLKYTGRFGIDKKNQEDLLSIVKEECFKLNIKDGEKTLFLGSEEFMYIPMLFAKQFKEKEIYYHSTTRSPIVHLDVEGYPIKSKFIHHSLYNEGVVNYVYNIDKYNYDKCFFFCELNKDKFDFAEIINIISNTNIKELNIVTFR
ncbi:phosphoribosyltransferase family protein [Intestinibacter sp.]